jgi:hypothetical protein
MCVTCCSACTVQGFDPVSVGLFVSVDADKGRALAYAGALWLLFVHGQACICFRCTADAAPYL